MPRIQKAFVSFQYFYGLPSSSEEFSLKTPVGEAHLEDARLDSKDVFIGAIAGLATVVTALEIDRLDRIGQLIRVPCEQCATTGHITRPVPAEDEHEAAEFEKRPDGWPQYTETCTTCGGRGQRPSHVSEAHTIVETISAGMRMPAAAGSPRCLHSQTITSYSEPGEATRIRCQLADFHGGAHRFKVEWAS